MHWISGYHSEGCSSLIFWAPTEEHKFFWAVEHSFMVHFSTRQKILQISDSLLSIKQGEAEMLRDFIVHFNSATLEVRDLNNDMAISTMKRWLKGSRFTPPWIKLSLGLMLNFWSMHISIFTQIKMPLTDAKQKEKIRKKNRRKVELQQNQIG